MAKLLLLRHFQSQWNLENRFAGWSDIPLVKGGSSGIKEIAGKLSQMKIDAVYTSPLIRNQDTVVKIWENIDWQYPIFFHLEGKMKERGNFKDAKGSYYVPVYISEKLNERYYGKLQGCGREEIRKQYGYEQFTLWRRSFNQRPPGGESLKDTFNRTVPFYRKHIEKDMKSGKTILMVASHNSLRSLVKYIEKIKDEDIADFEIPVSGLIEYEFDASLKLKNKTIL